MATLCHAVARCGGMWRDHPGLKKKFRSLFHSLKSSYVPVLEARGLAGLAGRIFIDFHRFLVYFIRFHGFQGQKVGALWQRCGNRVLAPKEEMLQSSKLILFS